MKFFNRKPKEEKLEDKPFELYAQCPECGFVILFKDPHDSWHGIPIPTLYYESDRFTICEKCGRHKEGFKQVGIATINGEEKRRYYE